MKIGKRWMLIAVASVIILGATPASAQLAGTWSGTGTGTCFFSGITMRPWENWTGVIPASEDEFEGPWWDGWGNLGTFQHTNVIWISTDIRIIEGEWTLIVGTNKIPLGTFKMTFYTHNRVCEGEWNTTYPTVGARTIQGSASP